MRPRPSRATPAGRAYLDLRQQAKHAARSTDELLQFYALEGLLDRLSTSPYASQFVLKGGVLLAAFGARRPTRDLDLAAVDLSNDVEAICGVINEVISIEHDDGLEFDTSMTRDEPIRDEDAYGGVRVMVQATLASADLHLHVDINFGDPLWPPPDDVDIPRVLGGSPIRFAGYRVELVLAEKLVTAIQKGTSNTRFRDFVDVGSLKRHDIEVDALVESIKRVAEFRGAPIRLLSRALEGYAQLQQRRWTAWRRKQDLASSTPADFEVLVSAVIAFADPLLQRAMNSP